MARAARVAFLTLLLAAPAQAEDVSGRVFEQAGAGRVPAQGAYVIVHWAGRRPNLWHYESVCIQAAIGRTDAQGRVAIPEPPPLRSTFLVFRDPAAVTVWKPGFDEVHELRRAGEWALVSTKMDAERRASFAESLRALGCPDDKGFLLPFTDPQGVLPSFRAALAAESPPKEQNTEVRVLRRDRPQPADAPYRK